LVCRAQRDHLGDVMAERLKIGIYLGFAPNSQLSGEGLARYIGNLLVAIKKRPDVDLVVACPSWLVAQLGEFGLGSSAERHVEVLAAPGKMLIFSAYDALTHAANFLARRSSRNPRTPLIDRLRAAWRRPALRIAATTDPTAKVAIVIAAALLSPVVVFCLVIAAVAIAIRGLARRTSRSSAALAARTPVQILHLLRDPKGTARSILSIVDSIVSPRSNVSSGEGSRSLSQEILQLDGKRVIDLINQRLDVDVWYSPTAFWSETRGITRPFVLCLPDIVTREIPGKFAEVDWRNADTARMIEETIDKNDWFVTFSETIAQTVLIRRGGKLPAKIGVIPHGANSLERYIRVMNDPLDSPSVRKYTLDLIHGYRNVHMQSSPYTRDLDFENIQYIFYAAQARPNKNLLGLIKAYEIALREKFIYQKLILTANLAEMPDILNYVVERRLQYDVITMPRVPNPVLAALYRRATLAICPTIYEGGFPFTFGESMSVGTPVLLSRIPVVMEVLNDEPALAEAITFDPRNPGDIAEKLIVALRDPERLRRLEQPLFDRIEARTWDVVAGEYCDFFRKVSNGPTPVCRDTAKNERTLVGA
jgi:glycosyltransferase involved in cell wall biosynthesis